LDLLIVLVFDEKDQSGKFEFANIFFSILV
jgi:hypothetical protein